MLVVLSGLPGVGKTTLARRLAAAVAGTLLRIDTIEQTLRNAGTTIEHEGYSVAYAVAEDNLRLGGVVIADCVNPWPVTRDAWQTVATRAAVRIVNVEVICSDRDEHRRRVESRTPDLAGHQLPTWADVVARDYRPWTADRLVLDTASLSVEENVQRLLQLITPRG